MSISGSFIPGEGPRLGLPAWRSDQLVCALDGTIDSVPPGLQPERFVADGFRRAGEDFFAQLRGEFVVVLWDGERRTGAIVRDRLGDRPLHYVGTGDGGLVFASELPELLALLPGTPRPDEAWLAHWLARRVAPAELTPFAGVRRLPAGHLIRLEGRRSSVAPWWHPRPPETLDLSASEAAAELLEAMTAAVERALARAEAPGVMLSGGFDSASVAALASRERPLRAYSGVFPAHPAADESERIATVRAALGLPGVEQAVTGGGALGATLDFVRTWSVPPATPNLFLWQELMRHAAEDGVDVLLDGEGGDELFGCSPPLLADMLRRGRPFATLRLAREVPGMGARPRRRWIAQAVRRYAIGGAVPAGVHSRVRRARGERFRPAPWLADPLCDLLDDSSRDAWKRRSGPRWWAALVDAVGRGADTLGAADQFRREAHDAGLRAIHPWRDTELIDFVLRLPPELAFDPHLDRPLAREAMKGLVPDRVRLDDAKPYFNDLLADALTGEDRELVGELVTAPELEPYIRRDGLDELLDARRGVAWSSDGWRVATAAAWLRWLADPEALERLAERAGRPRIETRGIPAVVC
ncbi:MAG: asparagine synthetase B family protein [Thermoleophilaceae bacterium]